MTATITTTALITVIYFLVVRMLDMNEKEPLWAMALVFLLGAGAAALVFKLAPPTWLMLSLVGGALLRGAAKFAAVGAGVGILVIYGQRRGWEEFNGTMDGIVYGTCAGLGFGVGAQLVQGLGMGAVSLPGATVGMFSGFGTHALSGLADGVFGALIGIGFGVAHDTRSPVLRGILPVAGMAAGVLADLGYNVLRHGNALGSSGALRAHVALALPVVVVIVIAGGALANERRAIRDQLHSEDADGVVSSEDLAVLTSIVRRQGTYLRALASGQVVRWARLRLLHNLQAQLAFAKARAARESDPAQSAQHEAEAARVRASVLEQKRLLAGGEAQ